MIKNIITKVKIVFLNVVYFVQSLFWKKDEKVILFGSWFGNRFADNARYLYQYLSENKEKYGLKHVVWVTHSAAIQKELSEMGYECFVMDSKESLYYHKKAKTHIICNDRQKDILCQYSYRAKRINLWHGVGVVKKFGKASSNVERTRSRHKFVYCILRSFSNSKLYRLFFVYPGGWAYSYLLSPTEITDKQFSKSFGGLPQKLMVHALYPRLLLNYPLLLQEKEVLNKMKNFKKIILYLPTFRIDEGSFDFRKVSKSVSNVLSENGILWIQKNHTASEISDDISINNNVLTLPSTFDINVLLPHITLLVTDYSSVATDARYFHKPVLFYMPDYEEYKNGSNGFKEEAHELLSGPQFFNIDSLKEGLLRYVESPNSAVPENYDYLREKYWGANMDMHEIWSSIISQINKKM